MIRVYIAGSLTGSTLDYLENCRKMMKFGYELFRSGTYSPFVPAFDYHFALMKRDNEMPITTKEYYDYSMAWLEVSDVVFVLPNSENSVGTQKEVERANELGIPVVFDMAQLEEVRKRMMGEFNG